MEYQEPRKNIVAIYLRLSDEDRNKADPSQDSRSIQTQKNMLIEHALQCGWEIYKIYSDDDFSGADAQRPEYNAMLIDAEAGKFNIILCKTQSRFTRDMEHVERYIHDKFKEWDIRFVSLLDNADTDVRGNKKSRQINGLVNEWYIEDLSENVKSSFIVRKSAGNYISSSHPYGYLKDPQNVNQLIIDPVASKVVKRIFALYLDGIGSERIANILNQDEIPCPLRYKRDIQGIRFNSNLSRKRKTLAGYESTWAVSSVLYILRNRMYTGALVQNRSKTVSYKNHTRIKLPEDKWIICENRHEEIIDKDTFEQVQQMITTKKRPSANGRHTLFSGKLRCGQCGHNLIMNSVKPDGRKYYACAYHNVNRAACSGISAAEKPISRAILQELKTYLNRFVDEKRVMERIQCLRCEEDKREDICKQIEEIKKSIFQMQKAVKMLYMDRVAEVITLEQFTELNGMYAVERSKADSKVEQLQVLLNHEQAQEVQNQSIIELELQKQQIAKKYLNAEELTREMIEEFIDYVSVFNSEKHGEKRIEIKWSF